MLSPEPIYCPLNFHQDYIGNRDLDSTVHEGFTIGKKGKRMFFMIIWHGTSGNATIYTCDRTGFPDKRYVAGDTMITIHFKQQSK